MPYTFKQFVEYEEGRKEGVMDEKTTDVPSLQYITAEADNTLRDLHNSS